MAHPAGLWVMLMPRHVAGICGVPGWLWVGGPYLCVSVAAGPPCCWLAAGSRRGVDLCPGDGEK